MKEIGEGERGKKSAPATVMRRKHRNHRSHARTGEKVKYEGKSLPSLRARGESRCACASLACPDLRGATGPVLQRSSRVRIPTDCSPPHHHAENSFSIRAKMMEEGARKSRQRSR